ncbi:MAG: low-specificity L-threonine aldolase [Proteocatella sp.]
MKKIDFRSDTVTKPTKRMRDAMCRAEVGDDVYGDDETVNNLQKYVAELCGMEAALFVPSGTFCNQLALFTHCNRGEEVILPDECHIVQHEAGSAAIIAGVNLRTLPTNAGKMDLTKVEAAIRKERDIHYPVTRLICLENAFSDGTVVDLEYMRNIKKLANKYKLKVHLDGARFFNAVTSLNCDIRDIAENVDSINICLSKGLCAPIGSMLVGSKSFIEEALYKRKIMGGGMRQVGIIAAAGHIAVKEMRLRLVEDHDNARYLAERLDVISGIDVLRNKLDINMVFFKITDEKLKRVFTQENFEKYNILINPEEDGLFRFVTHYYISRECIDETINFIIKLKEKSQRQ